MNRPELHLIILGCLSCIFNGGIQPAFGVTLSKVIAVRMIICVDANARRIHFLEGVPTMRSKETGERDLLLRIDLHRSGLSDAVHHVPSGNDRLRCSDLTVALAEFSLCRLG